MRAVVEELFARDLIVLNGIDTDFFESDALTGGFGRDVQGKEDDELVRVRAIEKRPGHSFSVEGFVGDPILRFLDHRILAGGLVAVAFNRNNVRRVHRAHDVEVLALPAQFHKLAGYRSNAHYELQSLVSRRAQWVDDNTDARPVSLIFAQQAGSVGSPKRQTPHGHEGARLQKMCTAERGQEVIERDHIREVRDGDRSGEAPRTFGMEQIIGTHAEIENVTRLHAIGIVVVIFLAGKIPIAALRTVCERDPFRILRLGYRRIRVELRDFDASPSPIRNGFSI
jgi:hypothetical protein